MTDVVILRSNSVLYDVRVMKINNTLRSRYSVSILGWNRESLDLDSIGENLSNLKLFNFKAPIGKPTLLFHFPFFWIWIFYQLIIQNPTFIHSCDLDTAVPAYLYKLLFNKKLIFDVFDRYAMVYVPPKFKLGYRMINQFENILAKKSDALITVWHKVADTFFQKPSISEVIMNCPDDGFRIGKTDNNYEWLRLVYTGNVVRNRGLEVISMAIKELQNVELIYAGRIIDKTLFQMISNIENAKYKGFLTPKEASELESLADVIVILYDPIVPLHNLSIPNKIFIAMMNSIPTITNLGKEILDKYNCGIYVNYHDIKQIREAVIELRDNKALRMKLGKNGRTAFEEEYNWNKMEFKLLNIYDKLGRQKQE